MAVDVFVGDVARETSARTLRSVFGAHGRVLDVRVLKHRSTGEPLRVAFVLMDSESAAEAAIAALHGREVDGARLRVHKALRQTDSGREDPDAQRLRLWNVSPTLCEADLRQILGADGRDVRRIDLLRDPRTRRVRGVAFVDMGSAEDARAALRALDRAVVAGRTLRVEPRTAWEARRRAEGASRAS